MKKIFALWMTVVSTAVFGILYPEYILLSGTYEYIIEDRQEMPVIFEGEKEAELLNLLYAKPEQIRVSSKLLQYLTEEGKMIWKSKS